MLINNHFKTPNTYIFVRDCMVEIMFIRIERKLGWQLWRTTISTAFIQCARKFRFGILYLIKFEIYLNYNKLLKNRVSKFCILNYLTFLSSINSWKRNCLYRVICLPRALNYFFFLLNSLQILCMKILLSFIFKLKNFSKKLHLQWYINLLLALNYF